jgi:hypothetical protein
LLGLKKARQKLPATLSNTRPPHGKAVFLIKRRQKITPARNKQSAEEKNLLRSALTCYALRVFRFAAQAVMFFAFSCFFVMAASLS